MYRIFILILLTVLFANSAFVGTYSHARQSCLAAQSVLRPFVTKNHTGLNREIKSELNGKLHLEEGQQNDIGMMQKEEDIKKRVGLLADYANTDEAIQRVLLRKKGQLNDIFVDMLYLLDFAGGPQIGFSIKRNRVGSDVSKEVYKFNTKASLNEESITYHDFLKKKITLVYIGTEEGKEEILQNATEGRAGGLAIGTEMTMEEYFKREGVWDFVQKGLPSEIAGAFYHDEATGVVAPSSVTANTVKIEFDNNGGRKKTLVTNNQLEKQGSRKPFLEFHFHPDEDIRPSPGDIKIMFKNKVPMLILSPKGKGKLWEIWDPKELTIRVKPYLDKTDMQARTFATKAIKEGWIVGVDIDIALRPAREEMAQPYKVRSFINKIDSAA